MRKALNDIGIIIVAVWLTVLWLLHLGLEPTTDDVAVLVSSLVAMSCLILLRAVRRQNRPRT